MSKIDRVVAGAGRGEYRCGRKLASADDRTPPELMSILWRTVLEAPTGRPEPAISLSTTLSTLSREPEPEKPAALAAKRVSTELVLCYYCVSAVLVLS